VGRKAHEIVFVIGDQPGAPIRSQAIEAVMGCEVDQRRIVARNRDAVKMRPLTKFGEGCFIRQD
jgi:hypothetical protein